MSEGMENLPLQWLEKYIQNSSAMLPGLDQTLSMEIQIPTKKESVRKKEQSGDPMAAGSRQQV